MSLQTDAELHLLCPHFTHALMKDMENIFLQRVTAFLNICTLNHFVLKDEFSPRCTQLFYVFTIYSLHFD